MKIKRKNENTEDFLYSFPEERKKKKDKLPYKHELTCSLYQPCFAVKALCQEAAL